MYHICIADIFPSHEICIEIVICNGIVFIWSRHCTNAIFSSLTLCKISNICPYSCRFRVWAQSFNQMLQQLDAYYQDIYQQKLLIKNAEIRALQSQMDPHFLKPTNKKELFAAVQEAQKQLIIFQRQENIAKEGVFFLKDQLMQELTDPPCTLELKEKLQSLGLTMESYYVAAFKPVSDDPDLPALKKIIIEEKQSGRPKKLFIYSNSRLHYKKLPGCQKYLLSDLLHLLPCSGKKRTGACPC